MKCLRCAVIAHGSLALLLALAPLAHATTPEAVENPRTVRGSWVADMAGVLSDETEASINVIADSLKALNGAEIAVATVDNTGEQTPKQFATALFKLWGVGQAQRDNGVLVLIVESPHRVEVETGYGAEGVLPDGRVGRILDQYVIPRFKSGDYDGGTLAGVQTMAEILAGDEGADVPASKPMLPWTLGGGGLVAAVIAWFTQARLRRRKCATCHRAMRLLTPTQETAFLSGDEQLEEQLRSVNHRVWRCDTCQLSHIEHMNRWFSAYAACPKCSRRTLATTSHILVDATYDRSGSREVTRNCRRPGCGFTDTHRETIPRMERSTSSGGGSGGSGGSSSSSGGSFGGGSSGGGGAGRGW